MYALYLRTQEMSSFHFQILIIMFKNSHFEFLPSVLTFWPVFRRMTHICTCITKYISRSFYSFMLCCARWQTLFLHECWTCSTQVTDLLVTLVTDISDEMMFVNVANAWKSVWYSGTTGLQNNSRRTGLQFICGQKCAVGFSQLRKCLFALVTQFTLLKLSEASFANAGSMGIVVWGVSELIYIYSCYCNVTDYISLSFTLCVTSVAKLMSHKERKRHWHNWNALCPTDFDFCVVCMHGICPVPSDDCILHKVCIAVFCVFVSVTYMLFEKFSISQIIVTLRLCRNISPHC